MNFLMFEHTVYGQKLSHFLETNQESLEKMYRVSKKKSALGKHLDIATHGFKMCILYFEKDKLGSNPSRPLKGHP